jgi:coproporphyrinogen III oxidase-like Fe-S oxidoreductase
VTAAEREFLVAIETSNGDLIPRPLSLHICLPICTDAYLARLERELDLVARLFDRDREVVRIEFDATAPERVPPAAKSELLSAMRRQFHFSSAVQEAAGNEGPGVPRCGAASDWDLLGFGVGAASRIGDRSFRNTADLPAWEQAIDRGCLAVGPAGRIDVTSRHVATERPAFRGDGR